VSGAQSEELFVLALGKAGGQVSIRPIVVSGKQAHRLNIDSMFIHILQAICDLVRLQHREPPVRIQEAIVLLGLFLVAL
jgi:hypothetical protein